MEALPRGCRHLEGEGLKATLTGAAPGQYQVHVRVEASGMSTEAAVNVALDVTSGCGCHGRNDHSGWLLILCVLLLRRRWFRAA